MAAPHLTMIIRVMGTCEFPKGCFQHLPPNSASLYLLPAKLPHLFSQLLLLFEQQVIGDGDTRREKRSEVVVEGLRYNMEHTERRAEQQELQRKSKENIKSRNEA